MHRKLAVYSEAAPFSSCICLGEVTCKASGGEHSVGDVVELSCSVEYSGDLALSLIWTDDSGEILDAGNTTVNATAHSSVS